MAGPPSGGSRSSSAPRGRVTHPWVALSMLADGEGESARVVAIATVPSDVPKDLKVFVQLEAIADPVVRESLVSGDPSFREVVLHGALPFHEAYPSIGRWILEGRGFILYDPHGRQLTLLEQEFPRHGLEGVHFSQTPTLEIYRSVSKNAKARPTLERLIQENLGVTLSRGREAILALWRKGDAPGALEGLKEDVSGLFRLLELGMKRGTVKLDGRPIPVDWDRKLRGLQRAASAGVAYRPPPASSRTPPSMGVGLPTQVPKETGRCLLVFARIPRAGEGMPLVAAKLGDEASLLLQTSLVHRTIEQADAVRAERWLIPTTEAAPASPPRGWRLEPPSSDPIAIRLSSTFQRAFESGGWSVVAIDSECPAVSTALLEHAFLSLEGGTEVVLGPSERGGYYLIGMSRPLPELFDRVSFGSSGLFRATLDRALGLGIQPEVLERLGNVENVEDWEAAAQQGWLPPVPRRR